MLAAIGDVVQAARQAGIGLSVCGDAAADPAVLPLLLELGVRTVSVGAAKVPVVARWIGEYTASSTAGPSAAGPPTTGPPTTGPPTTGPSAAGPSSAAVAHGAGSGAGRAAVTDAG